MTTAAPTPAHQRAEAEINATRAREKLSVTVAELQDRLRPRELARIATRDLQDAGERAKRVSADTVRRNPGTMTGVVALVGLFLARHQVARLFGAKKKPNFSDLPPISQGTPAFIVAPSERA